MYLLRKQKIYCKNINTGFFCFEKLILDVRNRKYQKARKRAGQWWHTPLIPALGKHRQADLCEFEASLVNKS